MVEHRASPRLNVLARNGMIFVDVPSAGTTGLITNLSEEGLGLQFTAPMPDVATLEVVIPLDQGRLNAACDVIWSTPNARGLRFRDLSFEDRAAIRSWIQGLKANQSSSGPPSTMATTDSEALPSWDEVVRKLISDAEAWDYGEPPPDAPASVIEESVRDLIGDSERWESHTPLELAAPDNPIQEDVSSSPEDNNAGPSLAPLELATSGEAIQPVMKSAVEDGQADTSGTPLELDAQGSNTIDDVPASIGSTDTKPPAVDEPLTADETPSFQQPMRAAGGSRGLAKGTPEWAIRIASRHVELRDQLKVWREERIQELAVTSASEPANRPQPGDLAPSLREYAPAGSPIEPAISSVGLQTELADEIKYLSDTSPLTPVRQQRHRGIWWAIILIIAVAGIVLLWWVQRTGNRSAEAIASPAPAREKSLPPTAIGVVEAIEGKPWVHSDALGKGRRQAITGGAAVARELPTYEDEALGARLQGDVDAVLIISEQGVVQDVRITRGDRLLAAQVITAASHWRFTPFLGAFGPVDVELPVTFRFRVLTGQSAKPPR